MLVVSIVAMGKVVTPDEARQKISKSMSPRRAAAVIQNPEALRLVYTSHYMVQDHLFAPSYYVFNVGQNEGYVIAGADDRVPAVLGYSDCGAIDPDNMPSNMKAWLQGYEAQMEYLNRHPEAAVARRTVSGDAIAPLLTSKWNQVAPYNDLCPLDGTQRCMTGCGATAMAQIMNFWKYPAATTNLIPGYTTEILNIVMPDIPAGVAIDWDNILDEYNGSQTEAQGQAIANLMLLCGTSLQMEYTAYSSGSYENYASIALRSYFDYDDAVTYANRNDYFAAEWNQWVYDDLKAGRPIFYCGQSSGSGHAFVVDGYGGDDYFHINWGWGGNSDDYFLLSILDPNNNSGAGATQSSDGYSFNQGAVFGIQPNTGVAKPIVPVLTTNQAAFFCDTVMTRTGINQPFDIAIGFSMVSHQSDTYKYDVGLGYFDTDGRLLKAMVLINAVEWGFSWGYQTAEDAMMHLPFGNNLNDTTIVIKPISRVNGTETWYANMGTDINNIKAVIKGNTLRLSAPVFNMTGTLVADGDKEKGSDMPITATITNNGTLWKGEMFFLQNGVMKSGIHIDFQPGETKNLSFSIVPDSVGRFEFAVATRRYNMNTYSIDYTVIAADSIDVDSATINNLTLQYKVANALSYIVEENVIKLIVRATNSGSIAYDKDLKVDLYKNAHNGYYSYVKSHKQNVKIESGQQVEVSFDFEDLEDEDYFFTIGYITGGEWKYISTCKYTVQTHEPDGIQLVGSDADNGNTVIFGLNGNKLTEAAGATPQEVVKTLPKGVYIIRFGQQTKTIIKNE